MKFPKVAKVTPRAKVTPIDGIAEDVKYSSDNVIRSVVLRYRNALESIDRTTTRSVRTIVVIHRLDELNIMEELGNAALLGKEVVNMASFCK